MSIGEEFGALFRRDLTRLLREVEAFPDDASLWKTVPGVTNPAGNLVLHLEGNLRDYIGRQMAGIAYHRARSREFGDKGATQVDLVARVEALRDFLPPLLDGVPEERWGERFPSDPLGSPLSNHQFVVHLHGHFNYHLGQIDYLRRVLTGNGALKGVGL